MRNSGFSWKTLSLGKRLVFIFASLAVVFIAILMTTPLGSLEKRNVVLVTPKTPKTKEEIVQNINHDSDSDGLKDWEEKIYGTDPNNPDTDGDGTPDGEEIKAGRNPLKSGHKLPDGRWSDALSILRPPDDGNKTTAIANEVINRSLTRLIANALSRQPVNSDLKNSSELNAYINSLASQNPLAGVNRPDSREFTTSPDNSPPAVKKYFNAIAQIYINNFSAIDTDISVLAQASESGDAGVFQKLDGNIAAIEKAIREIKETPVPYKWLGFAKDDTWYLAKTLAAVKILRNTANDAASSLLVLQSRFALLDDFAKLYADTKLKLAAEEIKFSADEPAGRVILE